MNLNDTITYDNKDFDIVVKQLVEGNRRGDSIAKADLRDFKLCYIEDLNTPYYLYSDRYSVSKKHAFQYQLRCAITENGYKSILKEFELAKQNGDNIFITSILKEQCNTFITRRELKNEPGKNCDIPFSLHAIYGEYKFGNINNINNYEFIEPYLKKIDADLYRTKHSSQVSYIHISPNINDKAKYYLHDCKYLKPIPAPNTNVIRPFKEDFALQYFKDTEVSKQIIEIGYERFLGDKILNALNLRDEFKTNICLEIRSSSPIDKPGRLYYLNDDGLLAERHGTYITEANKHKYIFKTKVLPRPLEFKNYAINIKQELYNTVIQEGKQLGINDYMDRFAIIKDHKFKRIKIDENYNFEYLVEDKLTLEDIDNIPYEDEEPFKIKQEVPIFPFRW